MRLTTLLLATAVVIGGCAGSSSGPPSALPPTTIGAPPPAFTAQSVSVVEQSVPVVPLYVAAAPDGSAYFGYATTGSNANLYRDNGGTLTQTQPAAPPPSLSPGGGVFGIFVSSLGSVYWLSAYFANGPSPLVEVECGAGANVTLCEPSIAEPTSMAVDSAGVFYLGGLTADGGGELATSTGGRLELAGEGVQQLITGPGGNVWALLVSVSPTGAQVYSVAALTSTSTGIGITSQLQLQPGQSAGSITMGGDGAIWFTDNVRQAIGRIDTHGSVREFPAPHPIAQPWYGQSQITTACDGSVWFTESSANIVARIDSSGSIVEVPLHTPNSSPGAISATSPHNACTTRIIWVGEQNARQLAVLTY